MYLIISIAFFYYISILNIIFLSFYKCSPYCIFITQLIMYFENIFKFISHSQLTRRPVDFDTIFLSCFVITYNKQK